VLVSDGCWVGGVRVGLFVGLFVAGVGTRVAIPPLCICGLIVWNCGVVWPGCGVHTGILQHRGSLGSGCMVHLGSEFRYDGHLWNKFNLCFHIIEDILEHQIYSIW
jgi:hypothetical protein